jgi:hypothetical protein
MPSEHQYQLGAVRSVAEKLKDLQIEELILSGKPYESAVTQLGKCIWRGLFSNNRY